MNEARQRIGLIILAVVLIVLTAPLTVRDPWFAGPMVAALWVATLVAALRPRRRVSGGILFAAAVGSLAVLLVLAVMVVVAV